MHTLRCHHCGKLLARYSGRVEVKCPRCKTLCHTNAAERPHSGDAHAASYPNQKR